MWRESLAFTFFNRKDAVHRCYLELFYRAAGPMNLDIVHRCGVAQSEVNAEIRVGSRS